MATERICPKCGTLLSSKALEGLCPKCMGRAAFVRDPDTLPRDDAGMEDPDADLTVVGHAGPAHARQEGAGARIGRYTRSLR